jgi:hypothetical protein
MHAFVCMYPCMYTCTRVSFRVYVQCLTHYIFYIYGCVCVNICDVQCTFYDRAAISACGWHVCASKHTHSSCLYAQYIIRDLTFSGVMRSRLHAVSTYTHIYRLHAVYACAHRSPVLRISTVHCTSGDIVHCIHEISFSLSPSSLRGCSAPLRIMQHTLMFSLLPCVMIDILYAHILCIMWHRTR